MLVSLPGVLSSYSTVVEIVEMKRNQDAGSIPGHGGSFSDGGEKRKRLCVRDLGACYRSPGG